MKFNSKTPRTTRTIAGNQLTVIQPYSEGHTLTEAEAATLNQTLAENFSNNLRSRIDDAPEGADLQAIVDEYMAEYEIGVRRGGGGGGGDPIATAAKQIARTKVAAAVKAAGKTQKEVNMTELVNKVYEANKDALHEQAAAVVEAQKAAQSAVDGALGIEI